MTRFDPDEMPAWLQSLWPRDQASQSLVAGINEDDCAVVEFGSSYLVVTADFLNARPIAEQLGIADAAGLGRLLVLSNLADLCGSGADPKGLLVGVTLPRQASVEEFQGVMLGIRREATKWNVAVWGGDTKIGTGRALLGVAIGEATHRSELFLKNGAKTGDSIWVSGDLGSCNAATLVLADGCYDARVADWARAAILEPPLPLERSRAVARRRIGHGGTDISDGLGAALLGVAGASAVGAAIYAQAIPIHENVALVAKRIDVEPWSFAFACGGDAQFLVTVPPGHAAFMRNLGFTEIGTVIEGAESVLMLQSGETRPLPDRGHRDARGLSFVEEIRLLVSDFALKGNP